MTTIKPRESRADKTRKLKAQGNEAMVDQNYSKAADLYTQALRVSPETDKYHCLSLRAGAHISMRNYTAACEDAEAAVVAQPRYAMGWNRLGRARLSMGSLEDVQISIDAYTKAIEYDGQGGSENSRRGLEEAQQKLKELVEHRKEIKDYAKDTWKTLDEIWTETADGERLENENPSTEANLAHDQDPRTATMSLTVPLLEDLPPARLMWPESESSAATPSADIFLEEILSSSSENAAFTVNPLRPSPSPLPRGEDQPEHPYGSSYLQILEYTLFNGNFVLDVPIESSILNLVLHSEESRDEFTHRRMSFVTCPPKRFKAERYILRPRLFAKPRDITLIIAIHVPYTWFDADGLIRTLDDAILAVSHFCLPYAYSDASEHGWRNILVVTTLTRNVFETYSDAKNIFEGIGVFGYVGHPIEVIDQDHNSLAIYDEQAPLDSFHIRGESVQAQIFEVCTKSSC